MHKFFLEKICNYATITKKKKNMKYLHFDFLHLMGTKFHGNFHRVFTRYQGKNTENYEKALNIDSRNIFIVITGN